MKLIFFLFEFLKIGLFTYGGGLAMIPILRDISIENAWLTDSHFTDLIAISQSTPGPIAINMATYIGYREFGVLGALLASIVIIAPAFILAILLGKFLSKFNRHPAVQAAFVGLKATVIGLVGTSVLQVALVSLYHGDGGVIYRPLEGIDLKALLMFGVFYLLIRKYQKHPLFYIAMGGVISLVFF
ncbi:chromate transporter [Fusibacter tunisiensis]|uniref:Chromate transporter n=1 Tax=Fusibacter tunisiensis TaxID=1008308 RepID=A0ABS2MQ89_9FIRM|nr:chromate transporter [Fusibacter tunisiensis]MBM7561558.1 chromate transporter [Fusibacter tunisiensis]